MSKSVFLERRIKIFSQIISVGFQLLGIILALVQIVKILPLLENYPGWTFTFGNIIALFLGVIIFYVSDKHKIKKIIYYAMFSQPEKMKFFLFSLPFLLMLLIINLKIILGHDSRQYIMLNTEGGLIEYGTSLFYFLGFAFSLPVAKYLIKSQPKIWGTIYYLFAIALLIIGLEEMSWGQRLIGWQSPDFFQLYNSQEETTIHNLEWFRHYLHQAYICIGFVGSFSWLTIPFFKNKNQSKNTLYFIPRWFISSFFLPSLIIFSILEYSDGFNFFISKDQESVELILSMGFFGIVLSNFFSKTQ